MRLTQLSFPLRQAQGERKSFYYLGSVRAEPVEALCFFKSPNISTKPNLLP